MFATNFVIRQRDVLFVRGESSVKEYAQSTTVLSKNTMTNVFCGNCGSLMWRYSSGFPGFLVLRVGQVDDWELHETKLRPREEQFVEDRVAWLEEIKGVTQSRGNEIGAKI
jgi:hypothetical protein